jgi:hypothetical protein
MARFLLAAGNRAVRQLHDPAAAQVENANRNGDFSGPPRGVPSNGAVSLSEHRKASCLKHSVGGDPSDADSLDAVRNAWPGQRNLKIVFA